MKISSITMVNMTNDEIVVLTILEKYALNLNAIYLMLWSLLIWLKKRKNQ